MKKHEAKIEILLSNIVTISFPYCPLFLSNIVTISEWSNAQNAFSATLSLLLCDLLLGNLDRYKNISTRLKLGPFEEDGLVRTASTERQRQQVLMSQNLLDLANHVYSYALDFLLEFVIENSHTDQELI